MLRLSFRLALTVSFAATAHARPYEDTKGRFRIELADGWKIEPRFGDTSGMVFARELSVFDRPEKISFAIEADGATVDSAAELARRIETRDGLRNPSKEAGARVAGTSGLLREYTEDGRLVRVWYGAVQGRPAVVRLEGSARALDKIASEVDRMLASLRVTPPEASEERPRGRFVGESGVAIELFEDGRAKLGGRDGRHRFEGKALILELDGGKAKKFDYSLDGDRLTLRSDALPRPSIYVRGGAEPKPAAPTLVGAWTLRGAKGPIPFDLHPDGRFELGTTKGEWKLEQEELELTGGKGQRIRYRIEWRGSSVVLSGGDLDRPVRLAPRAR